MSNLAVTEYNGQNVVDSRLIAEELGIEHKNFLATIRKYETQVMDFGHLALESRTVSNSVGARNTTSYYLLNEKQLRFILGKTRNGLHQDAIDYLFSHGIDVLEFSQGQRRRGKSKESDYSNALALSLNGKREVSTIAGNIDILTHTQIIEVKPVAMWKHALGQVLAYSTFYPSHQKRIHLFGETQESFLAMISSVCKKFNVIVTWES
jgi:hypothetical protein